MRLAALSFDLDEVPCYTAIHGLPPPPEQAAWAIYRRAVPRIEAWLAARGLPATFFAIGHDLDHPDATAAVRRLHDAGHEIANHSYAHDYAFSLGTFDAIHEDVKRGRDAIEKATGEAPVGFRAPGYNVVDTVFDALAALDVEYDSSVFPCPAYYGARAASLAWIGARGRASTSLRGDPNVLRASADPYRTTRPYWRAGDGLLELPIGVTRLGRLPYIGTSVVLAGTRGATWLTRRIVGRELVNLELHGIDFADCDDDGLEFLRAHQPDLRVAQVRKQAALDAAVETLRREGYSFVTLRAAAAQWSK